MVCNERLKGLVAGIIALKSLKQPHPIEFEEETEEGDPVPNKPCIK
jgi:hypothetical protein